MSGLRELLDNLRRFIEAGDESREYLLVYSEVRLLLAEIDKLHKTEVKVLTFDDIRKEVRLKRRAEAIANGIDAMIKNLHPETD